MHTYVLLSPYQINTSSVCFTSSGIERTWTFTAIILKASSFEYGRCEALNTISVKLRVRRCPCSEATSTLAAKLRVGSYARSEASSTLSKLLCKSTWRASRAASKWVRATKSDESVVSIGYVQICQVSAVVEINEDSQWMKRSLWDRVFVLDGPLLDHHRQEEDSAKKSTSEVSQLSIAYES